MQCNIKQKTHEMRAAICDDQPQTLEELKKMCLRTPFIKTVHTYSKMDNFWATLNAGIYYDVVFMDIDWKQNETGIDFAEKLYEACPYTKLIYVTAYTMNYVEDAFLSRANLSGFLKKPVDEEKLLYNLEKIRKKQSISEGKLMIYYQGGYIAIPFQDILYLESRLHKTSVVLKNREYLCADKLETLKEQLDGRFLNCHKSYVVNMQYIQELRGREIILEKGHAIPVSKARSKEAKEGFFAYMTDRL